MRNIRAGATTDLYTLLQVFKQNQFSKKWLWKRDWVEHLPADHVATRRVDFSKVATRRWVYIHDEATHQNE